MYNDETSKPLLSIQAHSKFINRIRQSPFNNSNVATCSDDYEVKIWNPNTNWTLTRTYKGHSNGVNGLEWINADTLASGSFDKTIQIWSISTGVTKLTIKTGLNNYALQLLSSGNLAVGTSLGPINIYNINTGSLIKSLIGHKGFLYDLTLISSTLLASGSDDKTIIIWDLTTYKQKFQLNAPSGVGCLKLVASNTLASGNFDGSISLWDTTTGKLIRTLKSSNIGTILRSVDLLTNNQTLVSGGTGQEIQFWDWTKGQLLETIKSNVVIHSLAAIQSKCFLLVK